ncbi:TetR/AcrR family transcriptional regulator [Frondihabitans cladoniiphilus]|uniref:TetR/AcrR family transcriptional regulator n=1 Tax=Frondihabitans cladoniiphilus TaxID=715785 RepID=A0ABP8VZD8_9MICO
MSAESETASAAPRRLRADAQRNLDAVLDAAKAVFAESGVDAPGQEIADRAGVGIGTMYRHFPKRSDLVAAVMASEIDACADAARTIAADSSPGDALKAWVRLYTDLVATKRGFAAALNSDDPALLEVGPHVREHLEPALETLLEAARRAGAISSELSAKHVITAVALLCHPVPDEDVAFTHDLVDVFLDGLR